MFFLAQLLTSEHSKLLVSELTTNKILIAEQARMLLKRDIEHLFDVLLCVKPFAFTLSPIHSVAAIGKTSKPTDKVCANRSAVLLVIAATLSRVFGVQFLFGLRRLVAALS